MKQAFLFLGLVIAAIASGCAHHKPISNDARPVLVAPQSKSPDELKADQRLCAPSSAYVHCMAALGYEMQWQEPGEAGYPGR